jgi:MraZ protein
MREWNLRMGKIRAVPSADEEKRRALRVLASRSEMLTWDGVGRMRVKDDLLKFAGLSNQVVLVGAFERFELWEPELWKQQVGSVDQTSLEKAVQSVGL